MGRHKVRIGIRLAVALFFAAGVALGLGAGLFGIPEEELAGKGEVKSITPALAGATAVDYLNKNLLQGRGVVAELRNVSEASGLYLVSLDIKKDSSLVQSAEVYLTKDGKGLLLGNIIDLTAEPSKAEEPPAGNVQKSKEIDVKMFVMAFCPYGKQAENGLGPAARLLGVDVEPHFVIYSNYRGGGPDFCIESGRYCSMHGIGELNEGLRQLCVYKSYKDKWWDYVDYVNSKCSLQNIESCWKDAASSAGIDASAIESCQKNDGASLAKSEYELNQKYSVQGSPTIFINSQQYHGGRSPDDFKGAFCSAFENPPAECSTKLAGSAQTQTASCG